MPVRVMIIGGTQIFRKPRSRSKTLGARRVTGRPKIVTNCKRRNILRHRPSYCADSASERGGGGRSVEYHKFIFLEHIFVSGSVKIWANSEHRVADVAIRASNLFWINNR